MSAVLNGSGMCRLASSVNIISGVQKFADSCLNNMVCYTSCTEMENKLMQFHTQTLEKKRICKNLQNVACAKVILYLFFKLNLAIN